MGDFQTTTTVTTRKPHGCQWCPMPIEAGIPASVITGKWEGGMFRVYFHADCYEALCRDPCTNKDPEYGCPYTHDQGKTCAEMPCEPALRVK